ncbi:Gfo/Idh/MocA family oxidoreductase [Nocardia terpenica]|uniref:Gfo/Idh/MocA family protein n=1 Tax=Nocardia terpenica TaxID=455432 RepID=UPI001896093C|nr:Gfo/Idh/MocA family oxidoreductase [Nocardia terpenica]MBF6063306.1 Gfo/Idh/MocA family oxidoreductase [Nocardia terpenica]MBF6105862.1 Gfo/Idh/MocA family oxidoreductase [Nocardia terpenica]MBF6113554.1 Gfo/Idh/MocA family oxidoreductase [Nocardia terpenica]MBF6119603.1 Gfo/Idh/MocA family oxidoreductase [Nocardia terpenica]MBF6152014.1 Gfo/Idh/MocA family oxidoreductase [Nocardia terpenica]
MTDHAIIGCGRVAPNHVDGFRALDDYRLSWACDRDPVQAKQFAADHGIARASVSVDEVLADPALASVSITVDHAQHADLVERALLADKHVLVEKPLSLTIRDAERLAALATARGKVLSVVSQHRYDPVVLAVREWLTDGLLGRLLYAQASLETSRAPEYYTESYWRGTQAGEGGSALINQGYHCLDVTRFLCGEMTVRAAVAHAKALAGTIETEDTLSALLVAGDTPVTLNVTVGSTTEWRTRIELVGDRGTVTFDIDHPGAVHRASGNPELERRADAVRARVIDAAPPGIGYYGISHRHQIADFAAAVRTGSPVAASAEAGVGMVGLLSELYAAAG